MWLKTLIRSRVLLKTSNSLPIYRYISEMVEDRWVHAARRLTSIEFSFDPCNIYRDCPRGVGYPADALSVGDSHPSCIFTERFSLTCMHTANVVMEALSAANIMINGTEEIPAKHYKSSGILFMFLRYLFILIELRVPVENVEVVHDRRLDASRVNTSSGLWTVEFRLLLDHAMALRDNRLDCL